MTSIQHKLATALITVAAIFFLAIGQSAADSGDKAAPGAKAAPGDKAGEAKALPKYAAVVNGTAIPYAEYSKEMEAFKMRSARQGRDIPEEMIGTLSKQIVSQMVNNVLLMQQGKKEGISVKDEVVNKELDGIKNQSPDPKAFEQRLKEAMLTEDQLKEKIKNNLTIKSLLEDKVISKIEVTEKDAKAYFDENIKLFEKPEEVRARHILIGVEKTASDEEKAKARQKLADLKKRVDAGEDFAELAKTNSTCPSAQKGGDLGYFSKDRMVKPFADTAFALKANDVSDIVETQFGYHLIKVLDHRPAGTAAFDEVKERIVAGLKNKEIRQKINEYISALRDNAKIETFVP